MGDIQAMYGLWSRELTRFLRSWSQIVGWLATPLLILGFLAFSFRGVALPGLPADIEYVQYLVPGMAGFTILFSASFSGLGILSDRDVGFLKEILVAPVSRRAIVLGWTAGGATTAVIQSTLIILLSIPLGFRLANGWVILAAVPILLLLALTFIGFGLALASQFRDSQGFGILITFTLFPLLFLSGAIYPIETLPESLRYLALLNPLTYGIDAFREVLIGTTAYLLLLDVSALVIAATAMVVIAGALFERLEVV